MARCGPWRLSRLGLAEELRPVRMSEGRHFICSHFVPVLSATGRRSLGRTRSYYVRDPRGLATPWTALAALPLSSVPMHGSLPWLNTAGTSALSSDDGRVFDQATLV